MFSWLRRSPPPPKPVAGNPGMGPVVRVGFSNAQRTWSEEDHLVRSLAGALKAAGHESREHREWIEVGDGFTLLPQIVQVEPLDSSGVKTITTIQVAHPELVPGGVFEYQHSTGDDLRQSLAKGFKNWIEVDLPVFLEARAAKPTSTMMLEFKMGEAKVELTRSRRVVLGPTHHLVQKPLATDTPDEHPFCLCCLFTNSVDAFREPLSKGDFYGIRLFAMRNADGTVEADCRINGADWAPGIEALAQYARTWPDRGFEYRKQYVAIRSLGQDRRGR